MYKSNFNLPKLHVGLVIPLTVLRITHLQILTVNIEQRKQYYCCNIFRLKMLDLPGFATYQNNIYYQFVQILVTHSVQINVNDKISTLVRQHHFQYF